MKKLILVLVVLGLATTCFAKEYRVTLDDKYVAYFEAAFTNENITPTEWLSLQALNLADQVINQEYVRREVTGKTRDEKISVITR